MSGDRCKRERAGVIIERTAQTTLRMTDAEREAWERATRLDGRTLAARTVRGCNGELRSPIPLLSAPADPPERKAR
jgi:hypothetical protein